MPRPCEHRVRAGARTQFPLRAGDRRFKSFLAAPFNSAPAQQPFRRHADCPLGAARLRPPMLERLIDLAVKRRVAALVLSFGFIVFGIHTFSKLKIEAFPDVTNVQVMVITLYPGQAAEEIEKQVTIPIERALGGVPQVLIQRSVTSFGLSQVIVTFEDDVDIYFARQQISERLRDAEVPEGVVPTLGPNDTPVGQIYQYTLESDHHSPSELRSWQDWDVSKHLKRVAGVADVVSFGGYQKEYHVLADPGRLRQSGLTLK